MEGNFDMGSLEPTSREFYQHEADQTWLWKSIFYINDEFAYAVTYKQQLTDTVEPAFYQASTLEA